MSARSADSAEEPLRAELLTLDRLADEARGLARTGAWTSGEKKRSPLPGIVRRIAADLERFEVEMTASAREDRACACRARWRRRGRAA
jgi:hypothetical protein